MTTLKLHHGDCLNVLDLMEENSVDAVVTDPPYELGFMGRSWDKSGIAFNPDTWRKVMRVLKPGGHIVAFGAPKNYHRLACAIEDAGFEVRDCLMWVFGQGFPKSQNISIAIDKQFGKTGDRSVGFNTAGKTSGLPPIQRQELRSDHPDYEPYSPATEESKKWQGWGTALKPSYEPIILARKPLSEKTVAANVLKWGCGAINVDATRIATDDNLNGGAYAKDGNRQSMSGDDRKGAALGMFQPGKTAETEYQKPTGRWPANLCHDGSQEVMDLFPESASGSGGRLASCTAKGFSTVTSGPSNIGEFKPYNDAGKGSAARFFKSCPYGDDEWPGQNSRSGSAPHAENYLRLDDQQVASALSNAVTQSTPRLALRKLDCREQNTSVSEMQLKSVCELVITAIVSLEKRFSQGLPPERLILSDSHANIAAIQEPTGTITITINLSKSNGFAEVATLRTIETSAEHGAEDLAANSRLYYCAKANKHDRAGSKHPTVKPVSLMRWLVRMVTPPGGTILDPFAGSGTTGQAAIEEGFNPVLIERENEYVQDIQNRMKDKCDVELIV